METQGINNVVNSFFSAGIVDFIIVFVVLLGAIRGLKSGLLGMLGNVIGAGVGVFVAGRTYLFVAGLLTSVPYLDGAFGHLFSFFVIFIVVNLIVSQFLKMLARIFNIMNFVPGLSLIDKVLGSFLGAMYSVILVASMVYFASRLNISTGVIELLNHSRLIGTINQLSFIFHALLPDSISSIESYLE